MAWLEKRGSKWVVAYRNETGKIKRVTGYTDRAATKQLLARFERARAHGAEGLTDPFAEHKARPLTQHVADYVADLRELGRDEKYVDNTEKRLAKLLKATGWERLADIDADSFARWRETVKKIGPATKNQYLETIRAFGDWGVKRKRMASNPLKGLEKVDETADVRRARRALSERELDRLIPAVAKHHRLLYRFILATGLRRQEAADLIWADLHVDGPTPFLTLRAEATKSRRADSLPLRGDITADLKKERGQSTDIDPVFPSLPTMEEHRGYLTAAGIDWTDSEGRRADFHALRHTYGTLLSKSGVSPRETMELMRHTDLRLTMKVYTDPRIFDLAGAVEKLPIPLATPAVAEATGTEGKAATVPATPVRVAGRVASAAAEGHAMAQPDATPETQPLADGDVGHPMASHVTDGKNSPVITHFIKFLSKGPALYVVN